MRFNKNIFVLTVSWLFVMADVLAVSMKEMYYTSRLDDTTLSVKQHIECCDSLLAHGSNENRRDILERKGELCFMAERYVTAASIFAEICSDMHDMPLSQALNAVFKLAQSQYFHGDYEKCVLNSYRILQMEKPDSIVFYDILAKILISDVHRRIGKCDVSQKFLEQAAEDLSTQEISDKGTEGYLKWYYHRAKVSMLLDTDQIEQALDEVRQARIYEYGDSYRRFADDIYIALIYDKSGEPEIAEEYYKKLIDEPMLPYLKLVAVNNYSWVMLNRGDYDEVLKLCNDYRDVINSIETIHLKCYIYNLMASAYIGKGDYKEAFFLADSARMFADTIFAADSNRRIMDMLHEYEALQDNLEKESMQHKERVMNIAIAILSVLFVISVALLALFYIKNRRLAASKLQLETEIAGIDASHRENLRSIEEETDLKNRELTAMAMWMARISGCLDGIVTEIEAKDKPSEERFRNIRNHIRQLDLQKNEWELFKMYFGKTHQSFFSSLYAAHPDLTKGEIKMCALMTMNLTTKDIAGLTNRSVRTVEVIKYNLRKKMNITEPTESYLRRFL